MSQPSTAGLSFGLKLVAAFAAVYVIWGSTYLAIAVAIETLPPFVMAGIRFLIAGSVLFAVARLRGAPAPAPAHWRTAALCGGLMLLLGNGGVVWAEHSVPSGLTALLIATEPMFVALLGWLQPGGSRPDGWSLLGLLAGFSGVAILVGPAGVGGQVDPVGAAVLMMASCAWAAGSLIQQRSPNTGSSMQNSGMLMLCGGALLLAFGTLRGEWARIDPASFSWQSVTAFLYLVVFGSLVGFSAYTWLLKATTPAKASTYAYVNPVVAVLLGWAVLGEPLTWRVLAAAAVIVAAVAFMTRRKGSGKSGVELEPAEAGAPGEPLRFQASSRSGDPEVTLDTREAGV